MTFENAAAIYRANKQGKVKYVVCSLFLHLTIQYIRTNKLNLVQADKEYVIRYFEQIGSVSFDFSSSNVRQIGFH